MQRLYELDRKELKAVIMLYRLASPFMTPKRIYARWKTGKLNLLKDYRIWKENDFLLVCRELYEQKDR